MERITIEIKSKSKRNMLIKILDALDITYREDNNPSPGGDRWFLDAKNIGEVKKGLANIKEGKVKQRTLTDIKDILGI